MHRSRATARTILDEVSGSRPDFIEHQLGQASAEPPTDEPTTGRCPLRMAV